MILNIIILLLANTILPLLPVPPEIALPFPLIHLYTNQVSVYEHMNLNRLHTKQQFKKAFRESIKVLHPDRGGDPVAFSRVKNLKKIMEQQTNYYDTLNITDADLQYNMPFKDAVNVKQTTYYVEAGIYYFIVLLYALAYTIQDDMRPARKYLLPLILIFAAYEAFMHLHPQYPTVLDFLNNKIPIFMQKTMWKTILSVLVSIVRTKFKRRVTEEKSLLADLKKQHTTEQYKNILIKLSQIYKQKVVKKLNSEKSWGNRIRGWISKGFTILILFSIARGFFGSSESGNTIKPDL